MNFIIKDIPKNSYKTWTVEIDGKEKLVEKITITSKFGEFTYGLRPEKYDGLAFHEQNGGGVIFLPYYFDSNRILHVGLIFESRPNMGEKPQLCAIGGFREPGESPEKSQARETLEETGLDSQAAVLLPGLPLNPNRTLFIADPERGEGINVFALEISENNLPSKESDSFHRIHFFPWHKAISLSPDAIALAAIARLLATLFPTSSNS